MLKRVATICCVLKIKNIYTLPYRTFHEWDSYFNLKNKKQQKAMHSTYMLYFLSIIKQCFLISPSVPVFTLILPIFSMELANSANKFSSDPSSNSMFFVVFNLSMFLYFKVFRFSAYSLSSVQWRVLITQ